MNTTAEEPPPIARIGLWSESDLLRAPLLQALHLANCEISRDAADAAACDVHLIVVASDDQVPAVRDLCLTLNQPALVLAISRTVQQQLLQDLRADHDVELHEAPDDIIVARLFRLLRAKQHDRVALGDQPCGSEGDPGLRDPLTGLHNRRYLQQRWAHLRQENADKRVEAAAPLVAAGVFDLDHFKSVNDRYGHQTGDDVLVEVGRRLARRAVADDLLVRLSGDEFVWVLFDERAKRAHQIFDDARKSIAAPIQTEVGTLNMSVSCGWDYITLVEDDRAWMARADQAVYAAKGQGRDRSVAYPSIAEGAHDPGEMRLRHFQNVARVVTERTTHLLSTFGEDLVRDALRQADQDALTQVFNRGYFDRRFERELELSRQQGAPLSVVVFDLDHFGQFNRDYGMPTADAVLQSFCRLAASCIRATDWLARYGGEEFVVVVRGPLDEACRLAERVRQSFESMEIESATGQRVRATVSGGVVQPNLAIARSAHDVILSASRCLQQAKQRGRNRVVCGN